MVDLHRHYNPNPGGRDVGDCTVRAICAATGEDWLTAYLGICIQGALLYNMPDGNEVWGSYLQERGWVRRYLRDDCPVCYTVRDFCREYPRGTYVLGLKEHVVTVIDGQILDTWDSGDRQPMYYWTKED